MLVSVNHDNTRAFVWSGDNTVISSFKVFEGSQQCFRRSRAFLCDGVKGWLNARWRIPDLFSWDLKWENVISKKLFFKAGLNTSVVQCRGKKIWDLPIRLASGRKINDITKCCWCVRQCQCPWLLIEKVSWCNTLSTLETVFFAAIEEFWWQHIWIPSKFHVGNEDCWWTLPQLFELGQFPCQLLFNDFSFKVRIKFLPLVGSCSIDFRKVWRRNRFHTTLSTLWHNSNFWESRCYKIQHVEEICL